MPRENPSRRFWLRPWDCVCRPVESFRYFEYFIKVYNKGKRQQNRWGKWNRSYCQPSFKDREVEPLGSNFTCVIKPCCSRGPPTEGCVAGFSIFANEKPALIVPCDCEAWWWGRWPPMGPPALPRPAPKPLLPAWGPCGTAPIGPCTPPRDGIAYGWVCGAPGNAGSGMREGVRPPWCGTPDLWTPFVIPPKFMYPVPD